MSESITGRDGYIINQALAYAIGAIEAVPENFRPESNRRDMVKMLHALVPGEFERSELADSVQRHTKVRPDLEQLCED